MHCGPAGSGHFVKMVHNGIEYGLMQAYAEGFDILHHKNSEELPEDQRFTIDTADVAEVWRAGERGEFLACSGLDGYFTGGEFDVEQLRRRGCR